MKPAIDFRSDTWGAIREYVAQKLGDARQKNDGPLSPDQTATLRGNIAAYKAILALETAPDRLASE